MVMDKSTTTKEPQKGAPLSFDSHTPDVQSLLLRGLAQQIGELAMPQLHVVKKMFLSVGLKITVVKEQETTGSGQ